MAVDTGRCLLYVLLVVTGMVVYLYWNATSYGLALSVEVRELRRQWTDANRTVATLSYQLQNCKAQVTNWGRM